MRRVFQSRWAVVIALLWLTALTRFALSSFNPDPLSNIDAAGFDRLAQNLLAGHGFSMAVSEPFCPESVRTPAYPEFLALIYTILGRDFRMVFLIQGLLDTVAAAVAFRLAGALWPRRRYLAGIVALFFYSVALSQWRFDNELLSEGLLTPLLALSVFLFWQAGRRVHSGLSATGIGVFLGIAVLCKPNFELAPLFFLIGCILIPRLSFARRVRLGAFMIGGLACVLIPWLVRNKLTFGSFFLSRTYDDNVARVSAVATLAEVNHETIQPWSPQWEALYGSLVNTAAAQFNWSNTLSCEALEQRRSDVAAVAVQKIREYPLAFVFSYAKGALRGLLPQEQFYWYERLTGTPLADTSGWANKPPALLVMWAIWLIGYATVYVGLIVGIFAARQQPHLLIVLLGLIVLGLFLPGPLAYSRFRVPVVPFMVVLQTVGLVSLLHTAQVIRRRHRKAL